MWCTSVLIVRLTCNLTGSDDVLACKQSAFARPHTELKSFAYSPAPSSLEQVMCRDDIFTKESKPATIDSIKQSFDNLFYTSFLVPISVLFNLLIQVFLQFEFSIHIRSNRIRKHFILASIEK